MRNNVCEMKEAISKIHDIYEKNKNCIIAVDGRCGAGKTTFAQQLQNLFNCNVIHMDDFFLPRNMRTEERLRTPGGNIHYERIIEEVFSKLKKNETFSYRPYSCKTNDFGKEIFVEPNVLTVAEGSYACHPNLREVYALNIFMDIDSKTQLDRITKRNGSEAARVFRDKWIPLEEEYFRFYDIREKCDIVIDGQANIIGKTQSMNKT